MDSGKISIIVPCFKQAIYLPEALDSVLAQTYSNWECIIVNDGSPDNTDEVAKRYMDLDTRFKYIKQQNKGLSTARNVGIENSCGEYILPLDADDKIGPTYLEKAIRHFESFPETKLIYCKAKLFGKRNHYWDLPPYDYNTFIWENCIFCTAMYRRRDYNKTLGYNVNMVGGNEDWDFWLSLLKKDDVVYRIDEILFFYRVKSTSMSTELSKYYLENNLVQLYNNHPEIYDSYKDRIIYYHNFLSEVLELKDELSRIRESHAYRLGKVLLKPLNWFKK